jgi:hypothetical protein
MMVAGRTCLGYWREVAEGALSIAALSHDCGTADIMRRPME